ncbi:MAG: hypothetical protein V3T31_09190, partial [candidate division Zixibacteria bacterium]
ETLKILFRDIYAALDLPLPYRLFTPHITVAREISEHRRMLVKERILPYLPQESFEVSAIDLVSPVAQNNWVSVRTFQLLRG